LELQLFAEKTAWTRQIVALGLLLPGLWSCQTDVVTAAGNRDAGAISPACEVRAQLIGALAAEIAWSDAQVTCEGMPRPGGAGARLKFAGAASSAGHPIAIIIAVPDLVRDRTARELASNVTLIEEGGGRFFSTVDLDICMTDIHSAQQLAGSTNRSSLSGTVYCVAPLAEVNGGSSVSIPRLSFTGLIDWSSS
jgi:hypothetical protein